MFFHSYALFRWNVNVKLICLHCAKTCFVAIISHVSGYVMWYSDMSSLISGYVVRYPDVTFWILYLISGYALWYPDVSREFWVLYPDATMMHPDEASLISGYAAWYPDVSYLDFAIVSECVFYGFCSCIRMCWETSGCVFFISRWLWMASEYVFCVSGCARETSRWASLYPNSFGQHPCPQSLSKSNTLPESLSSILTASRLI